MFEESRSIGAEGLSADEVRLWTRRSQRRLPNPEVDFKFDRRKLAYSWTWQKERGEELPTCVVVLSGAACGVTRYRLHLSEGRDRCRVVCICRGRPLTWAEMPRENMS